MANGRGDLMGTLSSILSNVDISQVMSLISTFMSQRPERNNNSFSGNLGSLLGNLDLGKLSETLTGFNGGESSRDNGSSIFGNLGNITNLGNLLNRGQSSNGLIDFGNFQSVFSGVTNQLQSLRKLRF